jgi:hypothetical protein
MPEFSVAPNRAAPALDGPACGLGEVAPYAAVPLFVFD